MAVLTKTQMVAMAVLLLVSYLILLDVAAEAHQQIEISAGAVKIDCGAACGVRCSLSSRPNLCNRACGTCCARCNCVPPGTTGNYSLCPCYANLTTRDGKPKCP